jgi:hypothetical protein
MSSFALLKAMTNASVLNTLADAQVRFAGSDTDVPGMFRDPSSVANLGVGAEDTSPTVTVATNAVPAEPADQLVQVDGVQYLIRNTSPDGTGLTKLALECVG